VTCKQYTGKPKIFNFTLCVEKHNVTRTVLCNLQSEHSFAIIAFEQLHKALASSWFGAGVKPERNKTTNVPILFEHV
jgi:hypothetical protein